MERLNHVGNEREKRTVTNLWFNQITAANQIHAQGHWKRQQIKLKVPRYVSKKIVMVNKAWLANGRNVLTKYVIW